MLQNTLFRYGLESGFEHKRIQLKLHWLVTTLVAIVLHSGAAASDVPKHEPLIPIEALDVPRYMGRWYEIAKFPNWFQRQCAGDTSAEYRLLGEGRVSVLNRCRRESGRIDEAVGEARQIGAADSPRLQVRFAPEWLSFLPFVWGRYWVIDIDAAYSLVAVSEPGREYLWVLSRTPRPDAEAYGRLLERLKVKGLDVSRLETTPHTGAADQAPGSK